MQTFFNYSHMKIRHIALVSAVLSAFCLTACDPDDYEYHDEYTSSEVEDAYTIVQTDLISASFRVIELAEVFSGYQEIRSEREKALRYVESFFNTRSRVYYEFIAIDRWGRIDLMDDGSFTAKPSNWKSYWIALNTPRELHIQMPQEHSYSASCTSEEGTWKIEAEVRDYYIRMSELTVDLESDRLGSVAIEVTEPLVMPMCNKGKGKLEPVSGKLAVRYKSRYADHSFEVEFQEYGKTFIMKDGTVKELDPAPAYGWNEY